MLSSIWRAILYLRVPSRPAYKRLRAPEHVLTVYVVQTLCLSLKHGMFCGIVLFQVVCVHFLSCVKNQYHVRWCTGQRLSQHFICDHMLQVSESDSKTCNIIA